jgi:parvulin-like peptidyl-prolyl isomerase
MSRRLYRDLLAGLTCAVALCGPPPFAVQAGQMADRIVAIVNAEVITLSELKTETQTEEAKLKEQYRGAELERRLHQLSYATLTRMIERKLQVQAAAGKGIEVSEADVLAAIKEFKAHGDKFDEHDPTQRRAVKDQLTLMRVVDREVRNTIMVADEDMRKYYETHRDRFSWPEEYRLSQILFLQRSNETHEDVEARARQVYERLKKGEDFSELAFKYSAGAESGRGGHLGFVRQGELLPEIEHVVGQLGPGQFSAPIETSQGFHIIRLDEKKQRQFRPFTEVKSEIQTLVYQEQSEDLYHVWLSALKNKAYIEIKF